MKSLRIGNFKAIGKTQEIPIRPITLIFGPNSSGKSSIIHALALAHEIDRTGNADVHGTKVGGRSIELGGFHQYVFRGDALSQVEFGITLDAGAVGEAGGGLFAQSKEVGVWVGIRADFKGVVERMEWRLGEKVITREILSGEQEMLGPPCVRSCTVEVDRANFISLVRGEDNRFMVHRLDQSNPVWRRAIRAVVEGGTTSLAVSEEDIGVLDEEAPRILAQMRMNPGRLVPSGEPPPESQWSGGWQSPIQPIGRANRARGLRAALRFWLPKRFNSMVAAVADPVSGQLEKLRYLGPLRTFPPRHFGFTSRDNLDWDAGGGWAWDCLARDPIVRSRVNDWLSDPARLRTPYEVRVDKYFPESHLIPQLTEALVQLLLEDWMSRPGSPFASNDEVDLETFSAQARAAWKRIGRMDEQPGDRSLVWKSMAKNWNYDDRTRAMLTKISAKVPTAPPQAVLLDLRTNTVVSHLDVGVGISQVVPVLVSLYGLKGCVLAIEQPELHLHPALQAELGDAAIESALGENRNTLLLETHSEHLILRILRRIRDTTKGKLPEGLPKITPSDVAVLYLVPSETGARVVELPVNERGKFDAPWPDGFFPERAKELFGQ